MEGIIGPSLLTPASKFAWIFCHAVKGMVRKSPWVRETLSILYFLLIHMLMTMILTMTVCKQQSVIKSWNIIVGVSGTTAQRKFSALLVTTVVILLESPKQRTFAQYEIHSLTPRFSIGYKYSFLSH